MRLHQAKYFLFLFRDLYLSSLFFLSIPPSAFAGFSASQFYGSKLRGTFFLPPPGRQEFKYIVSYSLPSPVTVLTGATSSFFTSYVS